MHNLSIKERLILPSIFPKESDIMTMTIVEDINSKIKLSQSELTDINFKTENNSYIWDKELEFEVTLSDAEVKVIKESLKKLDEEKKITSDVLSIYKKFN